MYFLYKLIDPITKEVKYIGYTKRPKTRLWEHIRDAKVGIKTYKCDWIRSLIIKNQKPIIEIISNYESQDEAANEEIRLIKELRESGYKLTNLTEGGSSKQIKKLIELNKKSRKGFLFQKLIHEPFI
jgi:predicted GIY-YIG superfamily endonuclease